MNLTTLDIKQKQFKMRFRGFDMREVDSFLEEITSEMEAMLREMDTLKDDKASLEAQVASYRDSEKALRDTLMAAQKMAEDMKAASHRDAELKVKEAELQAENILNGARTELAKVDEEMAELKRIKKRFSLKLRGVIEDHLKMLAYEDREEEKGA